MGPDVEKYYEPEQKRKGRPCQCCICKNAPLYQCAACGKMRSQNEGGAIFTMCSKCWDKHFSSE